METLPLSAHATPTDARGGETGPHKADTRHVLTSADGLFSPAFVKRRGFEILSQYTCSQKGLKVQAILLPQPPRLKVCGTTSQTAKA